MRATKNTSESTFKTFAILKANLGLKCFIHIPKINGKAKSNATSFTMEKGAMATS